ncbi:MAG: hypothetical protein KatS3mg057_0725 [Herpetosiphonaceae bacterium]|nr:MAG: hypothetical protein KatS3mg057_0725 [Herpetosiphonaceae bacterium]
MVRQLRATYGQPEHSDLSWLWRRPGHATFYPQGTYTTTKLSLATSGSCLYNMERMRVMRCAYCDKTIPDDALFCIYCGTRLQQVQEIQSTGATAPAATGPTIDLGRKAQVAPPPPPPSPQQSVPHPQPRHSRSHPQRRHSSAGFWLVVFGLILLFSWPARFWSPWLGHLFGLPGLLLLFGILAYSKKSSKGRHDEALRSLMWLGGLALLFATGFFWPGILLLAGVLSLLKPRHQRRCC